MRVAEPFVPSASASGRVPFVGYHSESAVRAARAALPDSSRSDSGRAYFRIARCLSLLAGAVF